MRRLRIPTSSTGSAASAASAAAAADAATHPVASSRLTRHLTLVQGIQVPTRRSHAACGLATGVDAADPRAIPARCQWDCRKSLGGGEKSQQQHCSCLSLCPAHFRTHCQACLWKGGRLNARDWMDGMLAEQRTNHNYNLYHIVCACNSSSQLLGTEI